MTAKEFIQKEALEYRLAEYDEGGFLCIDEGLLEQKLEEYHQAKLKELTTPDAEGRSEQLCDYCRKPLNNSCCNDCLEEMDSYNH